VEGGGVMPPLAWPAEVGATAAERRVPRAAEVRPPPERDGVALAPALRAATGVVVAAELVSLPVAGATAMGTAVAGVSPPPAASEAAAAGRILTLP